MRKTRVALAASLALVAAAVVAASAAAGNSSPPGQGTGGVTPIQHLVVSFQENVSYDHYFATYPHAANPPGEPPFIPDKDTPTVNGLNEPLLPPNNPNSAQPFRLDRSQYETTDQDHNYTDEQKADDAGLMTCTSRGSAAARRRTTTGTASAS